jgi:hypothetical protein
VIAYYLQNQAQIDAYLAERHERRNALRAMVEQRFAPTRPPPRLLARQAASEPPQ